METWTFQIWKPTDKGIMFRFNYTSYHEDYAIHVIEWNGTILNASKYDASNSSFNAIANNYSLGDYILDTKVQTLSLGINGIENGTLQVNPIYCKLSTIIQTSPGKISQDYGQMPLCGLMEHCHMMGM